MTFSARSVPTEIYSSEYLRAASKPFVIIKRRKHPAVVCVDRPSRSGKGLKRWEDWKFKSSPIMLKQAGNKSALRLLNLEF